MDESERERLSAMVDGEVDGAACEAACAGWKADPDRRRDWHAWHLIGDVLRSDDLASAADRDRRFLEQLRGRLAHEPVVLAPTPSLGAPMRIQRSRWMMPSAVAAGFVLVAGTFVAMRVPGDLSADSPAATVASASPTSGSAVQQVASGDTAAGLGRQASTGAAAEPAQELVLDGRLIRDAQLDRYLAAHKQFAGTSALGVPSAFLRSATVHAEPR